MIGSPIVAFVFPGQGSQSVGMLKDIALHYPEVEQTFNEASSILDEDLWALAQEGPQEKLDQTAYTQPALLAASYAIWRIIQSRKPIVAHRLAGHSLGEYTALVCAEALSFTDAIQLVAARGRFMQEAVPAGEGAMAAVIGLEDEVVTRLCEEAAAASRALVSPANFNSLGQVVISGQIAAVTVAMRLAKEYGAKLVLPIPVSVPSHCALMTPAADRLQALLATIPLKQPHIPVINNVDVKCYDTPESIREGLVRQLVRPVRWVEIIQQLAQIGVTQVIECGPGKILTGLNKRIDPHLQLMATSEVMATIGS